MQLYSQHWLTVWHSGSPHTAQQRVWQSSNSCSLTIRDVLGLVTGMQSY